MVQRNAFSNKAKWAKALASLEAKAKD